jgi:hypothetical protein
MPVHIKTFLKWFLNQTEIEFPKKTEGGIKQSESEKQNS